MNLYTTPNILAAGLPAIALKTLKPNGNYHDRKLELTQYSILKYKKIDLTYLKGHFLNIIDL